MLKQEEIRVGVTQAVGRYASTVMIDNPQWEFDVTGANILVNQILEFLHSRDVVIMGERQQPPKRPSLPPTTEFEFHYQDGWADGVIDGFYASDVAVESLIKEE